MESGQTFDKILTGEQHKSFKVNFTYKKRVNEKYFKII